MYAKDISALLNRSPKWNSVEKIAEVINIGTALCTRNSASETANRENLLSHLSLFVSEIQFLEAPGPDCCRSAKKGL
jgi:hypothetical protein